MGERNKNYKNKGNDVGFEAHGRAKAEIHSPPKTQGKKRRYHRYGTYGGQPTLLESWEYQLGLLSPKQKRRLARRQKLHNYLAPLNQKSELFWAKLAGHLRGQFQKADRSQPLLPEVVLSSSQSKRIYQSIQQMITQGTLSSSQDFSGLSSRGVKPWLYGGVAATLLIAVFSLGYWGLNSSAQRNLASGQSADKGGIAQVQLQSLSWYGQVYQGEELLTQESLSSRNIENSVATQQKAPSWHTGPHSLLSMSFCGGVRVLMGPDSRLSIRCSSQKGTVHKDLYFQKGVAHFHFPKQGPKETVTVANGLFHVQVRGTRFTMVQDEGMSFFYLHEGSVRLLGSFWSDQGRSQEGTLLMDKPSALLLNSREDAQGVSWSMDLHGLRSQERKLLSFLKEFDDGLPRAAQWQLGQGYVSAVGKPDTRDWRDPFDRLRRGLWADKEVKQKPSKAPAQQTKEPAQQTKETSSKSKKKSSSEPESERQPNNSQPKTPSQSVPHYHKAKPGKGESSHLDDHLRRGYFEDSSQEQDELQGDTPKQSNHPPESNSEASGRDLSDPDVVHRNLFR